MKTKQVIRKATALGSAALLGATTLMGALAYDLSTYPAKFIEDGTFDGVIVVGERAATADVIGSIDIAASLQAQSTIDVPTQDGRGRVNLGGDAFRVETGADTLELREPIGDVVDTVTVNDLAGLRSGRITTSEGTTTYNQYLRLQDQQNLQDMAVNYIENDDNELGDYLVVDTSQPFLEWEIQFPTGLESSRESDGRLTDIEDRTFNILGTDFNIVSATVTPGNVISMTLMGGAIADTLREGETKTYTIEGVDYEVTLVFVSDPNQGTPEVKFSINGEITQALEQGDTDTLSGGTQIGVRDILVNPREGVASFYLGAQKIVFDDNAGVNTFDGSVEINNENINDGDVDVYGQFTGANDYKVTSIRYRLTMDAESGAIAYVPSGQGVRQLMNRPDALLSETLDIVYMGLEQVNVTDMRVAARGDDRYEIEFTNIEGQDYTFPFVSNRNGIWRFGSDNDDLVFVEPANASSFNIGRNDYFIVSNTRSDADKSVTNVLRYDDYDTTDTTVELRDLSTGATFSVPITNSSGLVGEGNLVIGGHTYRVRVSDVTDRTPTISVDMNADGSIDGAEVGVTTWGGVVIDLVTNLTNAAGTDLTGNLSTAVGNGLTMGSSGSSGDVSMSATVLAKNFDDSLGDETINWTLSQAASDEVDLDFSANSYSGPRNNNSNEYQLFEFTDVAGDDERQAALTDWGIFVQEYDPSGDSPAELTLRIPRNQVFPQVFVVMGNVTTGGNGTRLGGTSGGASRVNPIAVGLAVLDRDAPRVGAENMIVVGGPCANTVAAELMDVNQANCGEDFEPGRAFIRTYEDGDNVAILVAGYESTETLGASRVLAQYNNYNLRGEEVELIVADADRVRVAGTGDGARTTGNRTTTTDDDDDTDDTSDVTGDDGTDVTGDTGFNDTDDDGTFGDNDTTNRTNTTQ